MNVNKSVTTGMVSAAAVIAATQADAQNWDGTYVGLSLNMNHGDAPWDQDGSNDYEFDGDAVMGFFIGQNFTTAGGTMMGFEFAYQAATGFSGDGSDPYQLDAILDAKFRVAFNVASNITAYGFGGLTGGTVTSGGEEQYSSWGMNYGVGAETMVGENLALGAELIGRTMTGYADDISGTNTSMGVGLRASFRF